MEAALFSSWRILALTTGLASTLLMCAIEARAANGEAQNCFGPPPFNCYSIGDIDPASFERGTVESLYEAYADFAWQDFLALNFPAALSNGEPTTEPSSVGGLDDKAGDYIAVWQTYAEAQDVFRNAGSPPRAWGAGSAVPDACRQAGSETAQGDVKIVVRRIAKADTTSGAHVLDEYIQANRMGPVVDRNGRYVRFAISFNKPMYDFIVENVLYTPQGQIDYAASNPGGDVAWPRGSHSSDVDEHAIGAIMVKAAWKILDGDDDPDRFHRVSAYVFNAAGGAFGQEPTVVESCSVETLGLVGFHIVHRTKSAPQWIWSTFEHVDNAPWIYDFAAGTPSGTYSFFDPATCPAQDGRPACEFNQMPDHPWNPGRADLTPTTVIRLAAPGRHALTANAKYRKRLREAYGAGNTVWENYFLVDVQFPTVTRSGAGDLRQVNPAYPNGLPTPTFLSNALMETYIQGFVDGDVTSNGDSVPASDTMRTMSSGAAPTAVDPRGPNGVYTLSGGAERNTSSCIGCHGDAAMVDGNFAGYVFSMSRAQSPPAAHSQQSLKDRLFGSDPE